MALKAEFEEGCFLSETITQMWEVRERERERERGCIFCDKVVQLSGTDCKTKSHSGKDI